MRIAIGQLWQETNTFSPLFTTRQDFEDFGIVRGTELVEKMASTNELGGFIQSMRAWPERPEIVGMVRLPAWPGGLATRETYAWLRDTFVDEMRRALPVDAVLLALHGALVADGVPDVEGAILGELRQVIGARIPLVATLDLHTSLTPAMVEHTDALVLFHTAPHIDVFETGQRGAAVLRRILVDGARPVTAFQRIPMVVPAERANTQDAASVSLGFRKKLEELEANPNVLSAGLATVQPWLDIPDLGSTALVVTDGDEQLATTSCAGLAQDVWSKRREYIPELVSVEEGVRQAFANKEGLVVLSDSADSTTSGAPGDSNWVLRELLKYDWPRPALVPLVSPEVVAQAQKAGIGAELKTSLGGVRDHRFSKPLAFTGKVANLFEARFILSGHLAKNLPVDMGLSAVLQAGNVMVIVTSRSGPHFAPDLFRLAGFDPFAASVLIAKSPCGFRAAYAERASKILVVRAPGCAPSDFWNYEYRNIPRPLWPWDEMDGWRAEPRVFRTGRT